VYHRGLQNCCASLAEAAAAAPTRAPIHRNGGFPKRAENGVVAWRRAGRITCVTYVNAAGLQRCDCSALQVSCNLRRPRYVHSELMGRCVYMWWGERAAQGGTTGLGLCDAASRHPTPSADRRVRQAYLGHRAACVWLASASECLTRRWRRLCRGSQWHSSELHGHMLLPEWHPLLPPCAHAARSAACSPHPAAAAAPVLVPVPHRPPAAAYVLAAPWSCSSRQPLP
jgi:hypothetical protein